MYITSHRMLPLLYFEKMKEKLTHLVAYVVRELYAVDTTPEFTRPEAQFGDFATNVAMQVAGRVGVNPREVAEKVAEALQKTDGVASVDIAGPGFINIRLTDEALAGEWSAAMPQLYAGQTVVAEYSDPNPFKVLHAGHLYTSVVGDAIANLFEAAGASVHRVNFGGDVGLHVAKTMWAIVRHLGGESSDKLSEVAADARSEWMAARYLEGNDAYESDESAQVEIVSYNKRIYALHTENEHESNFARIYWTTRDWSYDYFDSFYASIGSKFEKYYPESETAPLGLATVREHVGDVYEESDGAIIFDGEKHGLHTRVFINREGLPTYEAKDVGLALKKWQDYHYQKSIIITGNDIVEYMKVVMKSIEQFAPEAVRDAVHLTHGMVKLEGGVKMSSRRGNFLRAVDVLEAAEAANEAAGNGTNRNVSLGAVKYAFLKQRIGGDLIYSPSESVSLQGNSGPYLQYAHARACSILEKVSVQPDSAIADYDEYERLLARKLSQYQEVLTQAVNDLMPHHVCTYLFELAQAFNRFYEQSHVVGDPREGLRTELVRRYRDTLGHGLGLLGIAAPEKL